MALASMANHRNDSAMHIVRGRETPPLLRLDVLGAVSATLDGTNIDLGGPRVRALIAVLVMARGRTLPHDALLTAVWGEASAGIRSSLRASISRLRAGALGRYLTGGRQGYALVPGPGLLVDLWHVADLVGSAEEPRGDDLDLLAAASTLVAFDGVSMTPAIAAARRDVEQLVRRALIRVIDAHPTEPLALSVVDRALTQHPGDPELRALHIAVTAARRAGALSPAPASPLREYGSGSPRNPPFVTRRIGVPTPIAAYLPRPEEESRLAAAMRLSRLVTLAGPSGVGKSRLAVEWARGAASAAHDHVWFCQGAGAPWQHALALAVGAEDGTVESIVARLRPLRGVVVLDGLDHERRRVVRDLASILERAPGVSVLATARRALGVPGESVQVVAALSSRDARALFLLRAVPGGATEASPDVIDALTTSLARLPLGIELAAAQAAQTPLALLIETFAAAEDGSPLDAALDATLALLTDAQRTTLRALCIFRGPFASDSAIALAGGDTALQIEGLIAWSLLSREEPDGDFVRVPDIVARRVREATPLDLHAVARHTAWFAERTRTAFVELTTALAPRVLRRLDAERADIDAAFERSVEVSDRTCALSIAAGMAWAGVASGTQAAALARARRAAAVPGEAPAWLEAQARMGRGFLAYQLGSMDEAAIALDGARESARLAGDPELIALAHAFRAYLATLAPSGTRDAVSGIAKARSEFESLSPPTQAMVTLIGAQVERAQGRVRESLALTESARALAESAGHGWVQLMAEVIAAKVHLDARDSAGALELLRTALGDPGVRADPVGVLITASVAAGAAAGVGADTGGALIIGAVDAIGRRYGFDPRANEPADFEAYRRRVQQGLTPGEWRDAYTRGTGLTLDELVEEVGRVRP